MRYGFINWGGKIPRNNGALIFGFSLLTLGQLVACGDGVPQYGRLDASESMDTRGIPGAKINDYLGVEDVVFRFQGGSEEDFGGASEAEIAVRRDNLPDLADLVPDAVPELMAPLTRHQTSLTDPDTIREVIDLRGYDSGIRNQGAEGTCTAFAAVAAVENLANRAFKLSFDLSERAHWRTYQQYSAVASLKAAVRSPMIPESVWPYGERRARGDIATAKTARMASYSQLRADHREVITHLKSGHPIVIAMGVNRSLMNPASGGIVRAGRASGGAGHAVTIVGAIQDQRVPGGGYYIIKNSWGKNYGDNGYAYVAFDYCERTYCYFWSVNEVSHFKDGLEVSSNDATPEFPSDDSDQVDSDNPDSPNNPSDDFVPPAEPIAPVVPVIPAISADDFRLEARSLDLYATRRLGRNHEQGFYLSLVATPAALKEVVAVEYWTSDAYRNQGYFKASSSHGDDILVVDSRIFDSMFYPASQSGWKTYPARVHLKDGRRLTISGAHVTF